MIWRDAARCFLSGCCLLLEDMLDVQVRALRGPRLFYPILPEAMNWRRVKSFFSHFFNEIITPGLIVGYFIMRWILKIPIGGARGRHRL